MDKMRRQAADEESLSSLGSQIYRMTRPRLVGILSHQTGSRVRLTCPKSSEEERVCSLRNSGDSAGSPSGRRRGTKGKFSKVFSFCRVGEWLCGVIEGTHGHGPIRGLAKWRYRHPGGWPLADLVPASTRSTDICVLSLIFPKFIYSMNLNWFEILPMEVYISPFPR